MSSNFFLNKYLARTCLAAVITLGLAACSSSSDSGPSQSELDAANERADAAEEQQEQAEQERDALQDQLDAIDDQEQARQEQADRATARALFTSLDGDSRLVVMPRTVTAKHGENAGLTGTIDSAEIELEATMGLTAMGAWSGTQLGAKSGSTEDVAVIYTNVGPDEQVSFEKWASENGIGIAPESGSIMILPAHGEYVASSVFASGSGNKEHEFNSDVNGDGTDDAFIVAGTFNGATGIYRCTANCESEVTANGINLGGTWTFNPNDGARARISDTDFQYFGWWVRTTDTGPLVTALSGSVGNDDALRPSGDNSFPSIQGTATYSGTAVGKYAIYSDGPKGGNFQADVELKASFGAADVGGTISGMVDNFDGDGMADWSVTLPTRDLSDIGMTTMAAGQTNPVWSMGDADGSAEGSWSAGLYAADDGGTPQSVVGQFEAEHGPIGRMVGAFGATHSGP